jgi:thiol peroxidase
MERAGAITFKGGPLTLVGNPTNTGDAAPDFSAVGAGLSEVKLSDFAGQVVVISSVPSLDTPVCQVQTKRFNEEAAGLDAKILTISVDLPFAQSRFCETFSTGNVTTISDYKDHEFGQAYGLYIKELGLLARAVIVVGKDGNITYQELVGEATDEPDYDAALSAAREASAS